LASDSKSPGELIGELRELVVTYAKQETVDPLRRLGRFLAFGLAGAVLLGLGGVFLVVGILRLLQEETGSAFDGNWSFVPYVITLAVAGVVVGLAGTVIMRSKSSQLGSRT
jgi:hypothetical protein